jgi:hypothetical protein
VYGKDIDFVEGDFYTIFYDIPRAIKLIEDQKINADLCSIHDVASFVDQSNLVESHFATALINKDPIITVQYPPIRSMIIIDGSHRVIANALQNSNRQILCYILNSRQQYEVLAGRLFKNLYAVHYNLTLIINHHQKKISNTDGGKDISDFLLPLV